MLQVSNGQSDELKSNKSDYLDELRYKNVADLLSDSCVAFTWNVTCWSESVAEKGYLLFGVILFLISLARSRIVRTTYYVVTPEILLLSPWGEPQVPRHGIGCESDTP
jgi:peptidoglycan/LPS O-acetylase OafA/YrhL